MLPDAMFPGLTIARNRVRGVIAELDEARYLPEGDYARGYKRAAQPFTNDFVRMDTIAEKPRHRMTDKLWTQLMRYDLERDCAFTSFVWGIWVLCFQPIHTAMQINTLRGLRLCNEIFLWAPFPSDIIWGTITAVPALLQMLYIKDHSALKMRSTTMVVQATAFLLFTLLIALENPKTTGIPMYSGLAIAQLVCLAQLSQKRYCGCHE